MFEFLSQHGTDALAVLVALMALLKIIVRLTPTLKDDAVFAKFDDFFNAIIPNYTKNGKSSK
jgi:hypothetical protein|tara:strand:+ start:21324 stop:21509 length:186 start_codon:yes stop_codon:yes gene_type:complete